MQRRIAVCGAPTVGKATLLSSLIDLTGAEIPIRRSSELETIVRVDIKEPTRQTTLMTISGNFFYSQSTVLPWLVTGVHAIVYVSSVIPPLLDQAWYLGAGDDEAARQTMFWDIYTKHAAAVGSFWTSIPWIFVLNKIDVGAQNPLLARIPSAFHDTILPCSAMTHRGIPELWERLRIL